MQWHRYCVAHTLTGRYIFGGYVDTRELYKYQTTYLDILNDFFVKLVGKCATSFRSFDSVHQEMKQNVHSMASGDNYFADLEANLRALYSQHGSAAFQFAQELNACKLVLGGSSRFYETQLNATKRSILFSDTVLIPDPVLPYFERDRGEEKFIYINIVKAIFYVLQMKELNKNSFDLLPFFIFPSWEKSLEEHDTHTQEQISQLVVDVFNHYVDSGIQSGEDIFEYSQKYEQDFYDKIEKSQLFVAPGRNPGDRVPIAMGHYRTEMLKSRSSQWCDEHLRMPQQAIIVNAICERIAPQFHLLENSDELKSNPLLCIDSQAHYYKLVCSMKNSQLSKLAAFDGQTSGIVHALNNSRLDFLSNIEFSQMVAIRQSNENVDFRKQLRELVGTLPSTKLDDLEYVSGEVCSYIESLISKHHKEIETIKAKYQAKHKQTAFIGSASLTVAMFPVLAPFVTGVGLMATAGKYINDKIEEKNELKQASHSLMGVMSLAKSQ
ncbi:hypothetical protein [Vibrio alginolyticus]|uniref:hypothetical protein n=1 Tax=Vibrio alginolyticus TaxID=663 RepID=UPI003751C306